MSYLKGVAVLGYTGDNTAIKLPSQTNTSLNLTANTEDATSKDDVDEDGNLYPNPEVTYCNAELQVEGMFKEGETVPLPNIGASIKWAFKGVNSEEYTGTGLVTSKNLTAPKEGKATYSLTIQSQGKFTQGVSA